MTPDPTMVAVRTFLNLVTHDDPPSLGELSKALDRLAVAYHDTPEGEAAGTHDKPPEADYTQIYRTLAERFPDLGLYGSADPFSLEGDFVLGDAIDDLADIVIDLREVAWRFDVVGAQDAYWYLNLMYFHWGSHQRELARYLHAVRFS